MTDKRDTARQRRANQNKSAREALVARRLAAQKLAPEPEPAAKGRGRASRAQAAPVVLAKARGNRASGADDGGFAPPSVDDAPPASGILARTQQLPGGRQMLAGFVLILAGTPFAAFVPMFREKGSKKTESLVSLLGARSLILLLVPVVIAAIPLLTLNHRRRRIAWNVAAFLLGLWVLTTGLLAFYVLGLGSIVWGLMKSSRAEGPAGNGRGLFARSRSATRAGPPVDATGVEAGSDP